MKKKSQHYRATCFYGLSAIVLVAALASAGYAQPDHSMFIQNYEGAKTCEQCHAGSIAELQQTVHYKFESSLPENYIYDHDGNPATIRRDGGTLIDIGLFLTMVRQGTRDGRNFLQIRVARPVPLPQLFGE